MRLAFMGTPEFAVKALAELVASGHEIVCVYSQPPAPKHENASATETSLLAEADLATVTVARGAAAAGRLIREIGLRTKTGASIVALERPGLKVVNPGPDEEIQAGDRVLLLGTTAQIQTAVPLFEA